MTNPSSSVAAVLALVSSQPEVVEANVPVPPIGTSEKATALWYAVLGQYELTLGEMLVLEQLAAAQTHLDEVEAAWRAEGGETTSTGSMGQVVVEPRLAEMRLLRTQIAALVKALALPSENAEQRRRPGRPTRSQAGGNWGTAN